MSEICDNNSALAMLAEQAINKAGKSAKGVAPVMEEPTYDLPPKNTGIVFLSGKMTGLPDFGTANFRHWEKFFRSRGRLVMNPAVLPKDLPGEVYMPITLAMLSQCSEVFMIPDWTDSPGAMIERNFAIKCGKDVTYIADYAGEYDKWLKEYDKPNGTF